MEIRRYLAVFEHAGEDGWGAYVPDLPGCTAGGATMEDTFKAIQQSISIWIEEAERAGEPIPLPMTEGLSISVAN